MKVNYDKEFERIILENREIKICLHCCCAVCAGFCIERIKELGAWDCQLFFYNPNIMPYEEYERRAGEMEKLKGITIPGENPCQPKQSIAVYKAEGFHALGKGDFLTPFCSAQDDSTANRYICKWRNEEFLQAIKGHEACSEGGKRCEKCFYLRLKETAKAAKQLGYDYFASTLTISPHKNSSVINRIGLEVEKEIGIKYLVSDFKKGGGFSKSLEIAKRLGIYRQNYCGCRV